jgi:holliday junction DNA helicase RuvB
MQDPRTVQVTHLIGQKNAVEQVNLALMAAKNDGRRFDHSLMVGPPGLGKTTLAQIIAKEMNVKCVEILGQSITTVAELNAQLLDLPANSILFIDESGLLDEKLQVTLYLALDQKRVVLQMDRNSAPISIPIADFTLIMATTDEHELLSPLIQRCKLVLRFQFYSNDELVEILENRLEQLNWQCDLQILPEIAKRARGTPRIALRLLEAAYRVSRSTNEDKIELFHFQKAVDLEGINPYGCGINEQKYLQALLEGPKRLNVISSMIGLPARTVSQTIEPYLVRKNMVTKDDQSRRVITDFGREALGVK